MAIRRPSLFHLACALLAGLLAMPAAAQLRAPTLVEDGERAAEEPAPRPRPRDAPREVAPERERAPAREDAPQPPPRPAAPPPRDRAELPPPPPPPTATVDLARPIVPVSATWARLAALWKQRRAAEREQDPARASAAERAILEAKRELAIENLFTHAAAELRESRRLLEANLPGSALAHAEFAARLAPDFPEAHVAVARARLATPEREAGPVLRALGDAAAAASRDPHASRALVGDLLAAVIVALFGASVVTLVVLFARRVTLFLHDFHHLPLLRGTARVQTGFLAIVLLSLPLAFGLGPFAALAVLALAVWLYLGRAERVVATVALAVLAALPYAAASAARVAAWTGSAAETVWALEHGGVSDAQAAEIAARAAESSAPPQLWAALGRHAKRRGDLDAALRWYETADRDLRAPELRVNVGNVLFLKGDLEGAKAAYLAASDRAGNDLTTLAAAHYNLAKLYLRSADVEKSAAALDRAQQEDGEFVRRHGSDDDFSANGYLADVPVPRARIAALAASDGTPEAVREWAVARLAGALPPGAWPAATIATLAALWLLALAGRRLAASSGCERCGRPACRRCDGVASALCGQCVNVFVKRGVVDARDRLRKEDQVRRRARRERAATRALALVGGGAGHVYGGAPARGFALLAGVLFFAALVAFWRGVLAPPLPSAYLLVAKLAVAIPVGLLLYVLAVRDAFRRTG